MFTKDERVTDEVPQDGDQACATKALSQDGEHVLGANETTVEEGEAWKRHEQHQSGADHHEGVVTWAGESGQRSRRGHVVKVLFNVSHILRDILKSRSSSSWGWSWSCRRLRSRCGGGSCRRGSRGGGGSGCRSRSLTSGVAGVECE